MEAKVYVDEPNIHSKFCATWKNLYNTFLGARAKYTLAAQLEKTVQNLHYNGLKWGFMFASFVECYKTTYHTRLALEKKTDCVAYDPGTLFCHFINGIMDPLLSQAKLLLDANHDQFSCNMMPLLST